MIKISQISIIPRIWNVWGPLVISNIRWRISEWNCGTWFFEILQTRWGLKNSIHLSEITKLKVARRTSEAFLEFFRIQRVLQKDNSTWVRFGNSNNRTKNLKAYGTIFFMIHQKSLTPWILLRNSSKRAVHR